MSCAVTVTLGSAYLSGTKKISLPADGGKVRGLYMGVPFVGTLDSWRFHSFNGDIMCFVTFAPEERITVFGLERNECCVTMSEHLDNLHSNFCEVD